MTTSDLTMKNTGTARVDPVSFLDRFMRFIQRLPLPYWLTYLIFFLLQSTFNHVLAWSVHSIPLFQFNKLYLLYPFWLWAPLAIMTYLNGVSETALSSFSSLLDITQAELEELRHEFTTLPTRALILSAVLWDIVYIILNYLSIDIFARSGFSGPMSVVAFVEGLVSYTFSSIIYYHSIRQLRLVHRTLKRVTNFDLFNLDPVYAFSRLTARTGIAWMILLTFTLLVFPLQFARELVILTLVFQVVLAIAAFVLPLQIVNQKLVLEKRRMLGDVNQRIRRMRERLHNHLDDDELDEAGKTGSMLHGLKEDREFVQGLSTWPWSPGLLTGFLSAIVFPVVLLLIQIGIEMLMGR